MNRLHLHVIYSCALALFIARPVLAQDRYDDGQVQGQQGGYQGYQQDQPYGQNQGNNQGYQQDPPYGQNQGNNQGYQQDQPYGQNQGNNQGYQQDQPYGQNQGNNQGYPQDQPYGQNPGNNQGYQQDSPYGQNQGNYRGYQQDNPYGQNQGTALGNQKDPPYGQDQSRFARVTQMEEQDFGVQSVAELHAGPMHGPTPTRVPGGLVITTEALYTTLQQHPKGILIFDVLGGNAILPGAQAAAPASQPGNFNDQTQREFGNFLQQVTGGNKAQPVLFYCQSPQCWMSYNAALRAINLGYTQVLWYRGGIEAWQMAGLPTEDPYANRN